jgi:hypothetical protein
MSIKIVKRIGNCLINVTLSFVHLSVVVVKKEFVFNILCVCVFVELFTQHAKPMRSIIRIFICCLSPSAVSCTLFQIRQCSRKN